jgi:hypothetical protein
MANADYNFCRFMALKNTSTSWEEIIPVLLEEQY